MCVRRGTHCGGHSFPGFHPLRRRTLSSGRSPRSYSTASWGPWSSRGGSRRCRRPQVWWEAWWFLPWPSPLSAAASCPCRAGALTEASHLPPSQQAAAWPPPPLHKLILLNLRGHFPWRAPHTGQRVPSPPCVLVGVPRGQNRAKWRHRRPSSLPKFQTGLGSQVAALSLHWKHWLGRRPLAPLPVFFNLLAHEDCVKITAAGLDLGGRLSLPFGPQFACALGAPHTHTLMLTPTTAHQFKQPTQKEPGKEKEEEEEEEEGACNLGQEQQEEQWQACEQNQCFHSSRQLRSRGVTFPCHCAVSVDQQSWRTCVNCSQRTQFAYLRWTVMLLAGKWKKHDFPKSFPHATLKTLGPLVALFQVYLVQQFKHHIAGRQYEWITTTTHCHLAVKWNKKVVFAFCLFYIFRASYKTRFNLPTNPRK